ncbi:nucleotide-binding protein [Microbacterium invictum]|uniref:Nucleotide-binding protein n=1 Tax=Microbacterium invictum TaxID=515415 RepID=A0ABZ0VA94_9MICO|nr:nucleotide-binding protein [Microbacterium invictum]WQB69030.1 nucleotide-binding protein [Microbacterium invictum]
MEKTVGFPFMRLDVATLKSVVAALLGSYPAAEADAEEEPPSAEYFMLTVMQGRERWTFDDPDEFFVEFANPSVRSASFGIRVPSPLNWQGRGEVKVWQDPNGVTAEVYHPSRVVIQRVHQVLQEAAPGLTISPPEPKPSAPRVFIGHGRSGQWRDLRDHLSHQHNYEVEAYESGARAGHAIRDILEDMLAEANIAFLVMTAEDEQADGGYRARQNVVHEAGLFQGRLGFSRAIILLEDGVENLSNLDGIQYIRFGRGNIREAFGDVLATLRREFP